MMAAPLVEESPQATWAIRTGVKSDPAEPRRSVQPLIFASCITAAASNRDVAGLHVAAARAATGAVTHLHHPPHRQEALRPA
jgi:hypothetical protein